MLVGQELVRFPDPLATSTIGWGTLLHKSSMRGVLIFFEQLCFKVKQVVECKFDLFSEYIFRNSILKFIHFMSKNLSQNIQSGIYY